MRVLILIIVFVFGGFVVAQEVRQFINLPSYGAGYTQPAYVAPPQAGVLTEAKLREILAEFVRDLDRRNHPKKPNGDEVPQPWIEGEPKLKSNGWQQGIAGFETCAKCHDKAVATKKGDGFVLTDGNQLRTLSVDDCYRISREVFTFESMPKGMGIGKEDLQKIALTLDKFVPQRKGK